MRRKEITPPANNDESDSDETQGNQTPKVATHSDDSTTDGPRPDQMNQENSTEIVPSPTRSLTPHSLNRTNSERRIAVQRNFTAEISVPGTSTSPSTSTAHQDRAYVGRRIASERDWVN